VRNKQMPHHSLEGLGMWGQSLSRRSTDDDTEVRLASGHTVVLAHDADHRGAHLLRQFDRIDEAHADVVLAGPTAHREDEQRILSTKMRALEPLAVGNIPSLVVYASREFGHVVAGRVALEVADLPEVIDRVARVAGASAGTEDEQAPAPSAYVGEACGDVVDQGAIKFCRDRRRLGEVLGSEIGDARGYSPTR